MHTVPAIAAVVTTGPSAHRVDSITQTAPGRRIEAPLAGGR
ncbi:hypothetical protein ACIQV3_35805 [Streptomyces sp. NPDC099050]